MLIRRRRGINYDHHFWNRFFFLNLMFRAATHRSTEIRCFFPMCLYVCMYVDGAHDRFFFCNYVRARVVIFFYLRF